MMIKKFCKQDDGAMMIWFAFALPIMAMFAVGIIEYGKHLNRGEEISSLVGVIGQDIEMDYTDPGILRDMQHYAEEGNNMCVTSSAEGMQAAIEKECNGVTYNVEFPENAESIHVKIQGYQARVADEEDAELFKDLFTRAQHGRVVEITRRR